MGNKRKQRRLEERNARKQKKKEPVETVENPGRRQALKWMLGSSVVAVPALAYTGHLAAHYRAPFLRERPFNDIYFSAEWIQQNLVQIGPRRTMQSMANLPQKVRDYLIPQLEQELSRQGAQGVQDIPVHYRVFAYPDEPVIAQELLAYCQNAEEFMHNRLRGLDPTRVDWTIVREGDGDRFTGGEEGNKEAYDKKGFLIRKKYFVYEAEAGEKTIVYPGATAFNGNSYHDDVLAVTRERNSFFITVASGSMALSVFSELLPISTAEVRERYKEQVGYTLAVLAEEAITEVVNDSLEREVVREFGIWNGMDIVNENLGVIIGEGAAPRYRYVKPALQVRDELGLQKVWDIYLHDPAEFMKLVRSK